LSSWITTLSTVTEPVLDSYWLWVRLFGFIGILASFAYFLNKFTRKKKLSSNFGKIGSIQVLDTFSLGNKQFLAIAKYGHDEHLLGISPNSINYLAKVDSSPNEEVEN
jgi:flagellar biogenesis protein FliO